MKLLHILPDDKFWISAMSIFDRVDVENEYCCILNNNSREANFVDSDRVSIIQQKNAYLLWSKSDVDMFVFHSMPRVYYGFILSIPQNKYVTAISWGYDIYYPQGDCPPLIHINLYKSKTSALLKHINGDVSFLIHFKRMIKRLIRFRRTQQQRRVQEFLLKEHLKEQQNALNRIDFLATVLPTEFETLKTLHSIKAKYFPFLYASRSKEIIVPTIEPKNAKRVLVGNSADPSNNHIDIFAELNKRGITNELYVPLAYGDLKYSAEIATFLKLHSFIFHIQDSFLPISEYKAELQNCCAAVFGHMRQQAMGSIILCMLEGAKVFLYKESIAYSFLKSIGAVVFSIEDDLSISAVNDPLSEEENLINRNALNLFSCENVVSDLNLFFKEH